MVKEYRSTGYVYGKLWGGGEGSYPAFPLSNISRIELIAEAIKGVKEGWLDSGMGYECLLGALLAIEEIETIEVNSKEYSRSEFEIEFIGDLTDTQEKFLLDQYYEGG